MNDRSDRTLDRLGAAAGIAVVLLFLAIIMLVPALPAPNRSIARIAQAATEDERGILLGSYLGALLSGALLLFGAAIAARLRRAEGAGDWWLIALVGIGATAVGLTSDTAVVTFVRAVGHGVRGEALWTGYPSGPDGVQIAVPLAIFFLGAGLGARAAGALPRWLARMGVALAALFAVGAAGVTGDEVDGGILGLALLLAYLGLLVWTLGASAFLWRGQDVREPSRVVGVGEVAS